MKWFVLLESDEPGRCSETKSFEAPDKKTAIEYANKEWPNSLIELVGEDE